MFFLRALSVVALSSMVAACGERDTGPGDANRRDGGSSVDAPELDAPELDASAFDASAFDAPGLDAAGLDAPALDAPGLDTDGGTDAPLISMPCTATGACDPFDVASCASGSSCRLGAMGTECMSLFTTTARVGETCTRGDGCEPGSLCLDFGGGFVCHRMCPDGSIGFCGDGSTCSGTLGDACVRVCRPLATRCDIYAQDCADPMLACTLVTNGETGERFTGCRTPGTLTAGEMCGGGLGNCAGGLVCVRESGVSLCRAVCNPEAGGPACTLPQTCSGTTTGWGVRYCRDPA